MANRHFRHTPSGHRPTPAPPPKAFFLAALRIPSQTHPLSCGYSATYKRCLSASIRPLCAFMRQLSVSIRRASEPDPARHAARPAPSASAPAAKRQIEHVKIPKKGTFRPKTASKKFGRGLQIRSQMWEEVGESPRRLWLSRKPLSPPLSPAIHAASPLSSPVICAGPGPSAGVCFLGQILV